jgi:hypothetical protein
VYCQVVDDWIAPCNRADLFDKSTDSVGISNSVSISMACLRILRIRGIRGDMDYDALRGKPFARREHYNSSFAGAKKVLIIC